MPPSPVAVDLPPAGGRVRRETRPGDSGSNHPWPRISDYGIIGDCRSAALISRDGSLEWLCWPRFDSPAIFAALLDRQKGGHWRISAVGSSSTSRRYVPESNILETRFDGDSGSAALTDFMPGASNFPNQKSFLPDHEIIRRLTCLTGEVEIEIEFHPRAGYGKQQVEIRQRGKLGLCFTVAKGIYWLRSGVPLNVATGATGRAFARVRVCRGESLHFSLSYSEEAPAVLPPLEELDERIDRAVSGWRKWAGFAQYEGAYRDAVLRSVLTLKLLTYLPSGAIIAAPTTSLPERIGDRLNWDYRFCWLRDSSLTIRALLELGYWDEAEDFLEWLLQATRLTQPRLEILYSLYGDVADRERELEHLSGYRDSRPVRVGNAARDQLQLDVYGEVIDAAAQFAFHGGRLDRVMQKALLGFGNYVAAHWNEPDEGIWEPRCGRQNHTHSRVLCWTALDRLLRLSERGLLDGVPRHHYRQQIDALRRQIEERAWNPALQSYVSVLDGDQLDASLLLMAWYGFEEAGSPRMRATHRAIRKDLGAENGLLYRYRSENPEGAFAMCSFWEAEYLALGGGSLDEAKRLFEHLLTFANDVGLYGEEIDPGSGDALGNFPQAFTHVGLIGTALSILQREQGAEQLAHRSRTAKGNVSPGERSSGTRSSDKRSSNGGPSGQQPTEEQPSDKGSKVDRP